MLSNMFERSYTRQNLIMLRYFYIISLGILGSSAFSKDNGHLDKRSFYGDPRRNITCLGSSYDLQLPVRRNGVDPNQFTMQQLCAKTTYGGAPNGQHLGGWCSRGLIYRDLELDYGDSDSDSGPAEQPEDSWQWAFTGVSFDLSNTFQDERTGADPRFLLGCVNRCFCNFEVNDLTIQPKRSVPSNADVYMEKSRTTGEILLDVTDDVTTNHESHTGRKGATLVDTVILNQLFEPNQTRGYAYEPTFGITPWFLSLDAGNYITCEGDLPSFPLPQPYLVSDFQNSTQLCAVQWSGGLS